MRTSLANLCLHGTNERAAKKIMERGLLPRSMTGVPSNWITPSNPECVYFDGMDAPSYAMGASNEGDNWAFVTIDFERLDENLLRPDPQLLAALAEKPDVTWPPEFAAVAALPGEERLAYISENIDSFADFGLASLDRGGAAAYRGVIPRYAIPGYFVYKPGSFPEVEALITPHDGSYADKFDPINMSRRLMLSLWFCGLLPPRDYIAQNAMTSDVLAAVLDEIMKIYDFLSRFPAKPSTYVRRVLSLRDQLQIKKDRKIVQRVKHILRSKSGDVFNVPNLGMLSRADVQDAVEIMDEGIRRKKGT